ncbi:MAG: M23 family metallopeptidase [Clostridia bacterium]|nr:M23 family metallopeptidase [Clostridia bacterium]
MDRLLSEEERIKRAEDIVQRRKNTEIELNYNKSGMEKNTLKTRNIVIQILICLIIYCGFYYIKSSSNENTNKYMEDIRSILDYDINFKEIYNFIKEKSKIIFTENNDNKDEEKGEDIVDEVTTNTNEGSIDEEDTLGMGGELVEEQDEIIEVQNLEEEDVNYIKEKLELENPLKNGVITSKFGNRQSNEIVSANHKGIDIGAATGSTIISAANGIVIEASETGDFGKHLKIKNDDIIFIYGHCSELLVNEGDVIDKGQAIAKVGSTGRATGPHLHFEIRREDKAINPELVMKF